MSETASLPAPGQIARIRQRTYLVEQVVKPKRVADSTLVRLSCVDDDNQGQPLEVLWEKELDPTILTGEAWEDVAKKGFDDSRLFAAYLNTLKWNCVTSTDPRLFQAPFRAGIRLDAYQLDQKKGTGVNSGISHEKDPRPLCCSKPDDADQLLMLRKQDWIAVSTKKRGRGSIQASRTKKTPVPFAAPRKRPPSPLLLARPLCCSQKASATTIGSRQGGRMAETVRSLLQPCMMR